MCRAKNIAHFHGCGALRLNAATSAEQTHQRLGVAEGINSELQVQLQRVSAGHQVPHEALQPIIHQGMNLLRCQIETRSRIRLVEPKSLMPDRFGKKTGPSWRTWSYWGKGLRRRSARSAETGDEDCIETKTAGHCDTSTT